MDLSSLRMMADYIAKRIIMKFMAIVALDVAKL
jgi:hypothetical protein